MELKAQNELIDALIGENEDYTIKDFIELKEEIESIAGTKVLYSNAEIRLIKVKNKFKRVKYEPKKGPVTADPII